MFSFSMEHMVSPGSMSIRRMFGREKSHHGSREASLWLQRGPSTRFLLFRFQRLLPITPYHDDGEEAADNSSAQNYENDGDANCPDARWEEGMEGMIFVHEGLRTVSIGF
jgi:hypothetical protein